MVDRIKTVQNFLEQVDSLTRLPLITDDEMDRLFGGEVALALAELESYNDKERLCQRCEKRCCVIAGCELYSTRFSLCPIHDLRPVVCRLHFCHLFQVTQCPLVEDLSNVLFDCLLAADRAGSPRARLFDSPPLERCSPALVLATSGWVRAVTEGSLSPEEATGLIHISAEKYRTG